MRLRDFLTGPRARPSPTRAVKFRALGADPALHGVDAEAEAVLAFVPEQRRQEALRDADRESAKLYGEALVPEDRREDERKFHVLHAALRDPEDPRQPFADGAAELKRAFSLREASRLWLAYEEFVEDEFPDLIDAETFVRLVDEAKKKPLSDLISSFGYDAVRRSTPGLLAILKR